MPLRGPEFDGGLFPGFIEDSIPKGAEPVAEAWQAPEEVLRPFKERDERDKELRRLAGRYDLADDIGRSALLADNPDLANHLEYVRAAQSVVDARRSAQQNEGHIVIW